MVKTAVLEPLTFHRIRQQGVRFNLPAAGGQNATSPW